MKDLLIHIFVSILSIFGAWLLLSVGCELRKYKGGHRYIKAFPAKTAFQKLFTKMQSEKDIRSKDIGKLTRIGYLGVLLSVFLGIFIFPYSIYQFFIGKYRLGTFVICLWGMFSALWGINATIIQGVDSLINQFKKHF